MKGKMTFIRHTKIHDGEPTLRVRRRTKTLIERGLNCFRPAAPFFESRKVIVGQTWASAGNEIAELEDVV
jgi:hypothetical protein